MARNQSSHKVNICLFAATFILFLFTVCLQYSELTDEFTRNRKTNDVPTSKISSPAVAHAGTVAIPDTTARRRASSETVDLLQPKLYDDKLGSYASNEDEGDDGDTGSKEDDEYDNGSPEGEVDTECTKDVDGIFEAEPCIDDIINTFTAAKLVENGDSSSEDDSEDTDGPITKVALNQVVNIVTKSYGDDLLQASLDDLGLDYVIGDDGDVGSKEDDEYDNGSPEGEVDTSCTDGVDSILEPCLDDNVETNTGSIAILKNWIAKEENGGVESNREEQGVSGTVLSSNIGEDERGSDLSNTDIVDESATDENNREERDESASDENSTDMSASDEINKKESASDNIKRDEIVTRDNSNETESSIDESSETESVSDESEADEHSENGSGRSNKDQNEGITSGPDSVVQKKGESQTS